MEKRLPVVLFLMFAAFFWVANRGAYRGYFQDDDLDNLSYVRELGWSDLAVPMAIPQVHRSNFRPVGAAFYHVLYGAFGTQYTPYVISMHLLHLLNVALLWLVLRRLGCGVPAAAAGCLLWGFHMAAFDVFWKPMYVFDLLCGLFCLLSLLLYLKDRWLWSLLMMWLAYRSKEVAIMLPMVLAGYELLLGQKHWKRLIPFFALSLTLGVQALLLNGPARGAYALRFDPESLWTCVVFYAGRVFLIPWAGLAVLLLLLVRDRRVWFGLLTLVALLTPMLLLPGRLFSPYLYVPLIGRGIVGGALASRFNPGLVVLFFALWLPWNYLQLRQERRVTMANFDDRKLFAQRLDEFSRKNPDVLTFIGDSTPFNTYGMIGLIKLSHPPNSPIRYTTVYSPDVSDALRHEPLSVMNWDGQRHDLAILLKNRDTPDTNYIRIGADTPIWQLEQGWYEPEGTFRWTQPVATARLWRPRDARRFELVVNVGPEYIQQIRRSHVEVSLNGVVVGAQDFTESGWHTARWDLPTGTPGPAEMTMRTSPELVRSRTLGIAVVGFGFVK